MKSRSNTFRETIVSVKKKHSYPHLEDIHSKMVYAFTLSPAEQFEDGKSERVIDFLNHFDKHIRPLLKMTSYKLKLECSTESTNLHFHGTIYFASEMNIFIFYLNLERLKLMTTICIKKIDDPMIWYLYCIKQRHIVRPLLKRIFMPYCITNLTLSPLFHNHLDQK